jgi:hypothetical protein
MSYILDALRKSESERQRDAGTGLARTPLAAERHKTPVWIWIVIGLLSLSLIGLAAAWWRSDPGGQPPAVADTGIGRQMPAASAGQSAEEPATEPVAADADRLRSIAELPDFGPTLPEYRLEVLACCSSDPTENSAWINGRRYYPGERIGSGPVVAEIGPDGVVLAFAGQHFLLTTR